MKENKTISLSDKEVEQMKNGTYIVEVETDDGIKIATTKDTLDKIYGGDKDEGNVSYSFIIG